MKNDKTRYVYPGTNILINKFGIRDKEKLEKMERLTTSARMLELEKDGIPGNFDAKHLARIHGYIFQDIYDWAGKFRTVEISKNGCDFIKPELIRPCLNQVHRRLKSRNYLRGMPRETLVDELALTLSNLNKIHPFREGNGRTQRIFISRLAFMNSYDLDWQQASRNDMDRASFHANLGNTGLLRYLIDQNMTRIRPDATAHGDLSKSGQVILKAEEMENAYRDNGHQKC